MKLGMVLRGSGTEVGKGNGAPQPVYKLDPESREHPRLSPAADYRREHDS
jgi:hypothetical protein